MKNNQFFAEIIQTSLSEWTGQCWEWNHMPQFGSLVQTEHEKVKIFGIVHTISTQPNDPIRTPMIYQKTEAELLRDQPQIFEFLQTKFNCITLGYSDSNRFFYHLPTKPTKIHAFIAECNDQEYAEFFANHQFLHLLFNLTAQPTNIDELLLALLKQLHHRKILNPATCNDFIETISTLYKHDYQRLKIFLQRVGDLLG